MFASKRIIEKIKKINIEKYGVAYPMQNPNIFYKHFQSKIKNCSIGHSKEEDKIYNILTSKFPNTKRQYNSDLYPFNCDFYIPEIDTYIEYQGYWIHGNEPYVGSEFQKTIIEKWKSKNTTYFNRAVNVWTERDVLKRETAKKNKLNWIEFFNMKQFNEWFNNML